MVPPGYTDLQLGDTGYLYLEITGIDKGLMEGGFQYNDDTSIQPYAKTTTSNGFIQLNNGSAHYMAGNQLAVFSGVIDSGRTVFTVAGLAPSGSSPQTLYVSQGFQIANAGWMFYSSTGDTDEPGTDFAGDFTPCDGCSVSSVVSIAQRDETEYSLDGSYFGVDTDLGRNMIEWNQVGFGNWASNCVPGATLCTLLASRNPLVYFGGPQYYPDELIAGANLEPTTYGPYESFAGIDLGSDAFASVQRSPMGSFNEPLPPPPCGPDAMGYCIVSISHGASLQPCSGVQRELLGTNSYTISLPSGNLAFYDVTYQDDGSGTCSINVTWTPGDPSQVYGDPNLP